MPVCFLRGVSVSVETHLWRIYITMHQAHMCPDVKQECLIGCRFSSCLCPQPTINQAVTLNDLNVFACLFVVELFWGLFVFFGGGDYVFEITKDLTKPVNI